MTHLIRIVLGAALLATTACDSMPGALDPPPPGPATLRVRNAGSRTITAIDVEKCANNPNGESRWFPVSVGPSVTWTRQHAAGCHTVDVEFNSGGGWREQVNLTATRPTQINPF